MKNRTNKAAEIELYNNTSISISKIITQSYSTSFSIAVSLLPNEMRKGIYSIYGFVRIADEIVDTFQDTDQAFLLSNFERDYKDALHYGISTNPVLNAFVKTLNMYDIPTHLVDSFLDSMKADLNKSKYVNVTELNQYIYGSADVVGLMCLKIFVNGNTEMYNELEKPAMKLGSAFQKVNFLRDLKSDLEQLNRTYFHQFDVQTFNESIKQELITDIEKDFKEARKGIIKLPGKSKLAVFIAFVYYRHLLIIIKKTPAKKILAKRIRVNGPKKLWLMGNAYLKYQFNMI